MGQQVMGQPLKLLPSVSIAFVLAVLAFLLLGRSCAGAAPAPADPLAIPRYLQACGEATLANLPSSPPTDDESSGMLNWDRQSCTSVPGFPDSYEAQTFGPLVRQSWLEAGDDWPQQPRHFRIHAEDTAGRTFTWTPDTPRLPLTLAQRQALTQREFQWCIQVLQAYAFRATEAEWQALDRQGCDAPALQWRTRPAGELSHSLIRIEPDFGEFRLSAVGPGGKSYQFNSADGKSIYPPTRSQLGPFWRVAAWPLALLVSVSVLSWMAFLAPATRWLARLGFGLLLLCLVTALLYTRTDWLAPPGLAGAYLFLLGGIFIAVWWSSVLLSSLLRPLKSRRPAAWAVTLGSSLFWGFLLTPLLGGTLLIFFHVLAQQVLIFVLLVLLGLGLVTVCVRRPPRPSASLGHEN